MRCKTMPQRVARRPLMNLSFFYGLNQSLLQIAFVDVIPDEWPGWILGIAAQSCRSKYKLPTKTQGRFGILSVESFR